MHSILTRERWSAGCGVEGRGCIGKEGGVTRLSSKTADGTDKSSHLTTDKNFEVTPQVHK